MKKRFSRVIFTLGLIGILLGMTNRVSAQGQFIFSGEIRERGLFSHGYKALMDQDEHATFFVGQRTRLNFDYQNNDLGFFIQLEDGRIWGETNGAHSPGFGIGQAYFHMDFAQRFGFKIGRMALQYENGRYLSYSSWDECPKTHDALVFNFRTLDHRTKADLGGSFSNNSSSSILNPYQMNNYFKYLLFAYVSHQFIPDLRWSLLSVTDFQEKRSMDLSGTWHIDPTHLYARTTLGTYFEVFSQRKISGLVYAYGQFGKLNDNTKVASALVSAEIKYKVLPVFDIKIAYDYIMGNDYNDLSAERDHAFNKFLGSTHSFLGIMDYFSGAGTSDINQGLGYHQPCLSLSYRPAPAHALELNARYFWNAETLRIFAELPGMHQSEDLDRNLGLEMALIYKYKIRTDLDLEVGYAIHTPTKTLEILNGIAPGHGKFAHFGYAMLAYKPTLFNSANHPRKDR